MSIERNRAVQEIDQNLINELRREGRRLEANELVRVFRADCEKNKKQVKVDCIRRDKIIKKNKGCCLEKGCFDDVFKRDFCKRHYELKMGYEEKNKAIRKKFDKAGYCQCRKNKKMEGKSICQDCHDSYEEKVNQARKNKLCVTCFKIDAVDGKSRCTGCIEKEGKKRQDAIDKGVCTTCLKRESFKKLHTCKFCLDSRKRRR